MLTEEQIEGLRIQAERLTSEMQDELLKNIAKRISKAGQFTSTAAYETWKAQQLGLARNEIKKQVGQMLRKGNAEIEQLFKQSAEVGYSFDLNNHEAAIPFEYNQSLQQLLSAAVEQATSDFDNLVRTAGMMINGQALPLERAYIRAMDKAFMSVFTGVWDYQTAIRMSCRELADKGLISIAYDSGKLYTLEAAVRRNIMGGLGLMQQKVSAATHDAIGANGWEISAHANSAPDHEDIQGKQYTDEEFKKLNDSLARPIGTLNCGHAAFPIILGVSKPQFTPQELEQMKRDNATGFTYQGVHYSKYEATQLQRKLERQQRKLKRRILMAKSCVEPDEKDIQLMEIRLRITGDEYVRFSKAAGLRLQSERTWVAKTPPKTEPTETLSLGTDIDWMSNSFRPKYEKEEIIEVKGKGVKVQRAVGKGFVLYTESGRSRKDKAVKLVGRMIPDVKRMIPKDVDVSDVVLIDFIEHGLVKRLDNGVVKVPIGGYDNNTKMVYLDIKQCETRSKIRDYVRTQFSNKTEYAPLLHEVGHKRYYQRLKNLAKDLKIDYNEVNDATQRLLSIYIQIKKYNLEDSVSIYAESGLPDNVSETIAECFSATYGKTGNAVADDIMKAWETFESVVDRPKILKAIRNAADKDTRTELYEAWKLECVQLVRGWLNDVGGDIELMMIKPSDKTEAIWEAAQKALDDGDKEKAEQLKKLFYKEWKKEIRLVKEELPFV